MKFSPFWSPFNLLNQLELFLKTGTAGEDDEIVLEGKCFLQTRKSSMDFIKIEPGMCACYRVSVCVRIFVGVYWSQSSAPPHNLEVDYDFNDFLFYFNSGGS